PALLLEGHDPADAASDDHAGPLAIGRAAFQAGVTGRLVGGRDGKLEEAVVPLRFLLVDELERLEVLHFAAEADIEIRGIEPADGPGSGPAFQQPLPGVGDRVPQRGNDADTRYHDSSVQGATYRTCRGDTSGRRRRCEASRLLRRGCRCRIPSRTP